MNSFNIKTSFKISGDQPLAIKKLSKQILSDKKDIALLGVTGSGKTFTMANVIKNTNRTTMIIAPNKTLAIQLYEEMKSFFPNNAVEYFVSYYDYYQPEAYIPHTDTYIEKDALINEKIDLLRHSATRSLLERKDVIVVASVSCIYGLGSPELYLQMIIKLKLNDQLDMDYLQEQLVELHYKRNQINFNRGHFRTLGDTIDIFPSHYENRAWKISFLDNKIEFLSEFDPITNETICKLEKITIFANSHYVTPKPTLQQALILIEQELNEHLNYWYSQNKLLEAERIEKRTRFDIEMIKETGTCKGIENYSRYLSGRKPGEQPPTLFEYLPKESIVFIDESHVTVPQIGAMYNGDYSRKMNLIKYGFRLPSALDNRPLKFEEWEKMKPQTVYVSATLGKYELMKTNDEFIEQVIRPTGLLDPICIVKPATNQVDDVISESNTTIKLGYRVLITTLTKKMSENLSDYMKELGMNVSYLHSDISTLERIEIINKLRSGTIDVLIGVNLLREGLDIPECQLVAIMDADKEGFLRSETSLIQTIGRAARNAKGKVILYANKVTGSMQRALEETERRREKQIAYNKEHNIIPKTIIKPINNSLINRVNETSNDSSNGIKNSETDNMDVTALKQKMLLHAENLEFEKAAKVRDLIKSLVKDK